MRVIWSNRAKNEQTYEVEGDFNAPCVAQAASALAKQVRWQAYYDSWDAAEAGLRAVVGCRERINPRAHSFADVLRTMAPMVFALPLVPGSLNARDYVATAAVPIIPIGFFKQPLTLDDVFGTPWFSADHDLKIHGQNVYLSHRLWMNAHWRDGGLCERTSEETDRLTGVRACAKWVGPERVIERVRERDRAWRDALARAQLRTCQEYEAGLFARLHEGERLTYTILFERDGSAPGTPRSIWVSDDEDASLSAFDDEGTRFELCDDRDSA